MTGTNVTFSSGTNIYVTSSNSTPPYTPPIYTWSSGTSYTSSTIPTGNINYIWNDPLILNKNEYTIYEGQELKITMPNGAILTINKNGSYEVVDDGKILYKGCKIREFNRFINASDLLEEFIIFMGQKFNVRQGEILQIPIELFINWLIIRACNEDGDEIPQDVLRIEDHSYVKKTKIIPRCKCCGKFILRKYNDNNIFFCNSNCMDKLIHNKLNEGGLHGSI